MDSRSRKRKADVAPADHKGGGSGSAHRSLQPRLTSTAGGALSTASPSSASSSRAPLKLTQLQREQAAEQRRAQRQYQMAAQQRDKRAHNRARSKQLKENAEAAEAVAAAATAGPKDPVHWESVDTKHRNKHLLLLTKEKHAAELAKSNSTGNKRSGMGASCRCIAFKTVRCIIALKGRARTHPV
jgi:hypothetical protein